MKSTLYVTDLDGTLLTPEESLSPFTVRVINRLVEQGVSFTYATARSLHSSSKVTQGLTKRLPVTIYNGAFVRRADTGENLIAQTFSPAQRKRVEQALTQAGLSPLVYTLDGDAERVLWRPETAGPGVARYIQSRAGDPRLLPVNPQEPLYRGEIFYFTCIGTREGLLPAWEQLRREPGLLALLQEEIYQPGEFWLEVMPAGATKAHAAGLLKERLGCGKMTAFGDGANDLPLLEAADYGCAVENAVLQLKEAADEVIPPNTRDGVARWLLADTAPALALGERAGAFRLRLYRPEDLEELIQLFYQTVRTVNRRDYSAREVEAWVPSPETVDRAAWSESLAAHYTVVAEREGRLLGFGDMDSTGYLDRLYVHRDFQGRGTASAIVQALEGYAWGLGVEEISVHASRTARPFFQRRGYQTAAAQQVERRGVLLENFVMKKSLRRQDG